MSSLIKFTIQFSTEQNCIDHLLRTRWCDGEYCAKCGSAERIYHKSDGRFKCGFCKAVFTWRVGTIFESSNLPLRTWFYAIYMACNHKKGISSHQLARDLGITQKSAWHVIHRIHKACEKIGIQASAMGGILEVDETYMGGKESNKHVSKKVKGAQGRSLKAKTPVIGIMERGGRVKGFVTQDTHSNTITPLVIDNIAIGSAVHTDEWHGYNRIGGFYKHTRVTHGQGQYVNGMTHTNNIECFWSHLKRGIRGINHHTSKKHLQRYVDAFAARMNTRKMNNGDRFALLLRNVDGIKISYRELIR